jgi:trimethylamine--corrinoid protein Co-methyltransferase
MDREKMAVDVIRQVGPGGQFINQKHTQSHFREEFWQPRFLNRGDPETWRAQGGTTYRERVTAKALEILGTHQPQPLPENIRERLTQISARAEEELAGIQFIS